MLHNPTYDFNDELIPLGASAWVRLAESWLNRARQPLALLSGG
jgi:hippurate hydrolase